MTNGNSALDEALKKWIEEVDGNSIEVTSLMKSAYRDGWEDCQKLSVCADGGKGEAVGEIVGSENLHWARLFKDVPFGTKLYATPQAIGKGEAVAWLDAGRWRAFRNRDALPKLEAIDFTDRFQEDADALIDAAILAANKGK